MFVEDILEAGLYVQQILEEVGAKVRIRPQDLDTYIIEENDKRIKAIKGRAVVSTEQNQPNTYLAPLVTAEGLYIKYEVNMELEVTVTEDVETIRKMRVSRVELPHVHPTYAILSLALSQSSEVVSKESNMLGGGY